MSFLAELVAGDERLGGKARSLAELAAAGLPTPAGFVVTDALFRALCPAPPRFDRLDQAALVILDGLRAQLLREPWPGGFRAELDARVARLPGTRASVRSSFATEDQPDRLAAGVFASRVGVPNASIAQALREVLLSALAPGAVAYALAHGDAPGNGPVAVLVHEFIAGEADGSAAFAPGEDGAGLQIMVGNGQLPEAARAELATVLARLASTRGPVEIEWVLRAGRLVYLQARPFLPPKPLPAWPGWRELGKTEAREAWRWDKAHNPLPLSPAQAGLVELVDESCRIGIRQRVLGGYLFYRRDDRPLPPQIPAEEAEQYFAGLLARMEARLAELAMESSLEDVLALFVSAYQSIFGVLQPALRAAHARVGEFLAREAPAALPLLPLLRAAVPSVASERLALARKMASVGPGRDRDRLVGDYLARFGDEAAGWDVSLPTYAEAPGTLPEPRLEAVAPVADWQAARDQVEAMLSSGQRSRWRALLGLSRRAVALGEADDWLYAKTQAAVRRGLLSLGRSLAAGEQLHAAADVFYLPLALGRALAGGMAPPADLAATAEQGRQAWLAAHRAPPPWGGTVGGRVVRGIGVGGRALGRVVIHHPGAPVQASSDVVLVASTLLPTELPLLAAAALVIETGGLLDHVAAQARERNLPAVVGAVSALATFADGDLVLVDGERGLVVAVQPRG